MQNKRLISLAAVSLLMACGSDQLFQTDRMTGCYAMDSGKTPGLRVSRDSGRYRLAIRARDNWEVLPESLRAAKTEELDDLFRADTGSVAESLIAPEGASGLFRLKKGATLQGKSLNTEYVAFVVLAGAPVYKVACP
jgi:hypothetical protein